MKHADQFGTPIKTYKDYVEQARGQDKVYADYCEGKYYSRIEGFVKWNTECTENKDK